MDVEEDIFAGIQLPYDGSGSEYENSEEELAKKQKEKVKISSKSKANLSLKIKPKSGSQRATRLLGSQKGSASKGKRNKARREEGIASAADDQVSRNYVQSQNADSAKPSANAIKLPLRDFVKKNLKRKESPVTIEGDEPKKHWKKASNPKYLSLLNSDINNAIARNVSDDNIKLERSQIGSSVWTGSEKDKFFITLSRMGRDNVKAISTHIGTKSELEVQEYMQLLHTEFIKRRIDGRMLELPDFTAAFEISEECSKELERAADRLASLQEKSESGVEREKWGDSWLLTPEISHWLNKRRNQDGGNKAIDEVLPAANLFNLDKWLELSDRIFMNPSDSEQNWESIGDEPPSIRATAFEDFHSLAVFITKKLVSTTLYCTMSRERATQAQKTKHADVTPADVEAAVNILKLAHNSDDFWKKSARRCNLQVVDEDDTTVLPYVEVEVDLSSMPHSRRSRSRSTSRPPREGAILPSSEETSAGDVESSDDSLAEYEDENEEGGFFSDTERSKVTQDREAKVKAMEAYTESLDQQRGQEEEVRLWNMIGKYPADRLKEKEEDLVRPRRLVNVFEEQLEWREHVNFRSEWEVMEGVVEEEEFERNRNRVVKHRRHVRDTSEDEGPWGGLSLEFVDDNEEDLTPVEDEEINGSGEEDEADRSVHLEDNDVEEGIVGIIEEDEETGSEPEEGTVYNDHEGDNENMVEEAYQSEENPEEDKSMGQPEEDDEDEEEE